MKLLIRALEVLVAVLMAGVVALVLLAPAGCGPSSGGGGGGALRKAGITVELVNPNPYDQDALVAWDYRVSPQPAFYASRLVSVPAGGTVVVSVPISQRLAVIEMPGGWPSMTFSSPLDYTTRLRVVLP